jgi:D-arginine dehydrogenase
MRRTAFMVNSPFQDSADWPIVSNAEHTWYAKPDGPQFLCSPADETPSEPCDAKPEELDVAIAIDRINEATTLGIRSVSSEWAGLRTFAPDRALVIGPDPSNEKFFWLVGQGGIGIQTSPGAGKLVAGLVADGAPGEAFDGLDLDLAGLLPDRLRD